jgi:hypothetical protein
MAGLIEWPPATTHHLGLETPGRHRRHRGRRRVVDDGDLVTAAGVTSGLDLGLYLVERALGPHGRPRGGETVRPRTPRCRMAPYRRRPTVAAVSHDGRRNLDVFIDTPAGRQQRHRRLSRDGWTLERYRGPMCARRGVADLRDLIGEA